MPEGNSGAYGSGQAGLGQQNGQIAGPWGTGAGYQVSANDTQAQLGGEPNGPFGQHMETQNEMMGVGRDSMNANLGVSGEISTPMTSSGAAMPGVSGSS